MQITIKRIDTALPIPEYKTKGAAGFDLMTREDIVIAPKCIGYAPLNIIIAVPEGHMLLLAPRSSLHKKGLDLANSVGIVDQDFRGEADELRAALYNFSDNEVVLSRGDRIVQGIVSPIHVAEFVEVEMMDEPSRGGFGSTGVR
ncbi:MAG TPA: dUTP diphosphatase [Candidatus Paceibacterota bacterium]|nr:dUTP diphosphatase [Candidatus Paceibacterota bacterium]